MMKKRLKRCISMLATVVLLLTAAAVPAAAAGGMDDLMTRGELVLRLYEMRQKPEYSQSADFTDVPDGSPYADAVAWGTEIGIVTGYGGGLFGPQDPITREQLAVVLYRYTQYDGFDVSSGENTNILSYDDVGAVGEWAIPAMQWACAEGIVRGVPTAGGAGMLLEPKGILTVQQANNMIFASADMSMVDIARVQDRTNVLEYYDSVLQEREMLRADGGMSQMFLYADRDYGYFYDGDSGYTNIENEKVAYAYNGKNYLTRVGVAGAPVESELYHNAVWSLAAAETMDVVDARYEDGLIHVVCREQDPELALAAAALDFIPYVEGMECESRITLDGDTLFLLEGTDVLIAPDGTETEVQRVHMTYDAAMPEVFEDLKQYAESAQAPGGETTSYTFVENPGTPEERSCVKQAPRGDHLEILLPEGYAIYMDEDCAVPFGFQSTSSNEAVFPYTIYAAKVPDSPIDMVKVVEANSMEGVLERYDSMLKCVYGGEGFPDVDTYIDQRYAYNEYEDGSGDLCTDQDYYVYDAAEDAFYLHVIPGFDPVMYYHEYPSLPMEYLGDYCVTDVKETAGGLLISFNYSIFVSRVIIEEQGWEYEMYSHIQADLLLDPETYVILETEEYLVSPDGTKRLYCTSEYSYDVQPPEMAEELYARTQPGENTRTITLVFDPNSDQEQTFTYCAVKGDVCYLDPAFTESFALYSDAACTVPHTPIYSDEEAAAAAQEDKTLYCVPKTE